MLKWEERALTHSVTPVNSHSCMHACMHAHDAKAQKDANDWSCNKTGQVMACILLSVWCSNLRWLCFKIICSRSAEKTAAESGKNFLQIWIIFKFSLKTNCLLIQIYIYSYGTSKARACNLFLKDNTHFCCVQLVFTKLIKCLTDNEWIAWPPVQKNHTAA